MKILGTILISLFLIILIGCALAIIALPIIIPFICREDEDSEKTKNISYNRNLARINLNKINKDIVIKKIKNYDFVIFKNSSSLYDVILIKYEKDLSRKIYLYKDLFLEETNSDRKFYKKFCKIYRDSYFESLISGTKTNFSEIFSKFDI